MELLQSVDFWIGLLKIIWINIILSGDNAVVIALAARSLEPQRQKQAILLGSGAAVVLRIALTVVAARLLALPYLQIVGGLMLLWIGVQLLSDEEDGHDKTREQANLMAAVRTILLADLVMSLDNVIAVAAAAKGSTLMIRVMQRVPVIVVLGAGLIGWVAGETIVGDVGLRAAAGDSAWLHYAASAAGAVLVIGIGKLLAARAR